MKQLPQRAGLLLSLMCTAALTACGGGSGSTSGATAAASAAGAPMLAGRTAYGQDILNKQNTGTVTVVSYGNTITNVQFQNTGTAALAKMPVTFGHAFAVGDLRTTDTIVGKLDDGTVVPLQVDVKATHADGSVRHAVISAVVPALAASQTVKMALTKATLGSQPAATAVTAAQFAASGFSAKVTLNVGGAVYTASAEEALKNTTPKTWLNGRVANEWLAVAPLRDASGVAHPHLTARFNVRAYTGLNRAKVDVVIENDWAYQASPSNFTYDAQVAIGGQTVYSKQALTHYTHARWKKTFWWGGEPAVHIKHNTAYLIASRAVPNYDQSVVPTSSMNDMLAIFNANSDPMKSGLAMEYMPSTGGRYDLGLLPAWAVNYILTMDKDAKRVMLGAGDLAGSFSTHYRDQKTDRVVSVNDYPYMTIYGRSTDTWNPATGKMEAFAACVTSCDTKLTADSAHQPDMSYVPYLVTGDYYYLEELQFWTSYNIFQHNPNYREREKGLFKPDQLRGQAWSMRTLAEAAYITPDNDTFKPQFNTWLNNNIDYYTTTYATKVAPDTALGAIADGDTIFYAGGTSLAPWQDDFFTMATGRVVELGFDKAKTLLTWKGKFATERMVGDGTCWISGAMYNMVFRPLGSSGPTLSTMADVYKASVGPTIAALECNSQAMATALNLKVGEMRDYDAFTEGYPAYMQAALSYAVTAGVPKSKSAWDLLMARPYKPDYTKGPHMDILPR